MNGKLLTPPRVELAFWLMIIGGLLTGIGIETDWGRRLAWPLPAAEVSVPAFSSPPVSIPYSIPAPDAFLETALRPLFVITRRPAPPPPPPLPESPKVTMKKGQFVLTGTTIVDNLKYAHLIEIASGKAHTLTEGKEINGILIKQISPTRITLSMDEESEEISLRNATTPLPSGPSEKKTPAAPIKKRNRSGEKTPLAFRKRRHDDQAKKRPAIHVSFNLLRRPAS